jgi:Retroviral aspartyl protease
MNRTEAEAANDVVTGTFLVHNHHAFTLFDSGASMSFISSAFAKKLGLVPSTRTPVSVATPNGQVVSCDTVYEGVEVKILGCTLPSNLFEFKLGNIDVILGMDWLTKYKANIICAEQKVRLRGPKGERISYSSVPKEPSIKVVSTLTIVNQVRKGREAYLCYVQDLSKSESVLEEILINSKDRVSFRRPV